MDPQNGKYIKVRLCIPNLWHFLQQICFPLFFLKKHLWTNEDITCHSVQVSLGALSNGVVFQQIEMTGMMMMMFFLC